MFVKSFRGLVMVSTIMVLGCTGQAVEEPERAEVAPMTSEMAALSADAEHGDAEAQFNMGLAYTLGDGVSEDEAEAAKWWQKAAAQGHADSQYNLCQMYTAGQGVPQDYEQAAAWCLKAAEQDVLHAQYNLGWMYADGKGVRVDLAQSAAWYTKAAAKGHVQARANLGRMYQHGQGVDADPAIAYALYKLATADVVSDTLGIGEDQELLLASMSKEQLSAGETMAQRMAERRVDGALRKQGEESMQAP